jgi:hypothetical protein
LFKNRELAFQQSSDHSTSDELKAERNIMRDDISYIDGASAVLSAGNGKSFSVRSSKISKRSI